MDPKKENQSNATLAPASGSSDQTLPDYPGGKDEEKSCNLEAADLFARRRSTAGAPNSPTDSRVQDNSASVKNEVSKAIFGRSNKDESGQGTDVNKDDNINPPRSDDIATDKLKKDVISSTNAANSYVVAAEVKDAAEPEIKEIFISKCDTSASDDKLARVSTINNPQKDDPSTGADVPVVTENIRDIFRSNYSKPDDRNDLSASNCTVHVKNTHGNTPDAKGDDGGPSVGVPLTTQGDEKNDSSTASNHPEMVPPDAKCDNGEPSTREIFGRN